MPEKDENTDKTIMVVDDDPSVLSFISFSLKSEGFNVVECRSAEMALRLVKENPPNLILLDIMLPNMDGFTMCKEVRKISSCLDIPILFITAYADPSSLEKTGDAGAQGLIEKPIMFDELLLQIMDALNGKFTMPTHLKFAS